MNRVVLKIKHLILFGIFLAIVGGCSRVPEDGFTGDRGEVSGKITLDGKPLPAGCAVVFIAPKGSYTGTGVTSESGEFTLRHQVKAGMPVGDYLVQIAPPAEVATGKSVDPAKLEPIKAASGKPSDLKKEGELPSMYFSTTTSKLTFPVKKGNNSAVFELKSGLNKK